MTAPGWSFAGMFRLIDEAEAELAEAALEDERWAVVEPDDADEGDADAA